MSATSSQLDALAMTAWWTAAARARESQRNDRLFEDPWATLFVGLHGVEAFDHATQGSGIADIHAITTRFFDDFLVRITGAEGVQQVVLVAAGLDTRAFRLRWPPQTRLFELDLPKLITYKDITFSSTGAIPGCERYAIGVDLNESWTDSLCRTGFQPSRPSVWLLEGFIYFLAESDVLNLLQAITGLSAPGSWLGLDCVNADMLTSPSTRHWNERMTEVGTPWLFTSNEPEVLLTDFGWSARVIQPGEDGADFGRSYCVATRDEPGVPRSLLVTATRY